MNTQELTLLIAFLAKHELADFVFQTNWMMKKNQATGWILPLLSHVGVHGLLTATILIVMGHPELSYLAGIDLIAHFCIDRTKGLIMPTTNLGILSHRIGFSLDQGLHHVTNYFIIYMILNHH